MSRIISSIYRRTQIYYQKALQPYGITSGQFMFILHIYENEGITQEELSVALDMNKSTIARVIAELEIAQYVRRVENQKDKRKYHIYLTKTGKALYPKVQKIVQTFHQNSIAQMSEEEITYLAEGLEKMKQNVKEQTGEECK